MKFDANEEYRKGAHDYPLLPFFPNNAKAREARNKYGQTLLDSYEKVMVNTGTIAAPWGRSELTRLGLRLLDYQQYQKAVAVLRLAAERYPESWILHNLASAAETAGERELAIETYKKVLQLEPGNEEALKSIQELEQKRTKK